MMRSRLEKKVLGALETMSRDEASKYQGWWKDFGRVFKEGLYRGEDESRERILKLSLFESTHSSEGLTHLSDYVERMKSGQEKIYYATGESRAVVESSPHMEAYREKGYEVLIFTDTVDEVWSGTFPPKFGDFEFESILKGAGELGTEEERKKASETLEEKKKEYSSLLERIQKELEDDVKEVRLSNRLTSSVACLVGDDQDMTPQMEQMMKAMGRDMGKQKRILELNPDHSILNTLQTIFEANPEDERIGDYAELIHGQSVLSEGGKLSDPARFSRLITALMEKAL
jgi:molecular chaperone HtpG